MTLPPPPAGFDPNKPPESPAAQALQMVSEFDAQQSSSFEWLPLAVVVFSAVLIATIFVFHPNVPPTLNKLPVAEVVEDSDAGQTIIVSASKESPADLCHQLRDSLCKKLIECKQFALNSRILIMDSEDAREVLPTQYSHVWPATLNVSSDPSGAEVFLGNFDTGQKTPLVDYNLDPGTYDLRLVGTDGLEASSDLEIESGGEVDLHLFLKRHVETRAPMERCLAELDDAKFCVNPESISVDALIDCGTGIETMSCEEKLPAGCWNL